MNFFMLPLLAASLFSLTLVCIFSGNVVIETSFYDDQTLVSTSKVRIFYV